MKGDKTRMILEALGNAAHAAGELLDVFLTNYHESYRRARNLGTRRSSPSSSSHTLKTEERRLFYNLLSKLKTQGFIERAPNHAWRITQQGTEKRKLFRRREPAVVTHEPYAVAPSPEWKIIMFDIPEKERRKRGWLRATLIRIGCKPLQKSVFAGKIALPEQFVHDLQRLRLLRYVEIFAITKAGSLKQIE